jgi:hypothetical protein
MNRNNDGGCKGCKGKVIMEEEKSALCLSNSDGSFIYRVEGDYFSLEDFEV